ncbi:MAG: transcriptional repressor [Nitrospirae bacterium]|nr:transcriptional repressor [Nitrospirota bacterium]MCL5422021.1 transcriptional repressor [Nitrospirota bacterium]
MGLKEARDIFFNYVKVKNLRYTRQREKIVEAFLRADRHITAEELYSNLKKVDPEIGSATVHRTLKLMGECGLLDEIKVGSGKTRYELKYKREHHDHLICINCGRLIEVRDDKIERLQDKLARANDFVPKWHRLEIYGLCTKCR